MNAVGQGYAFQTRFGRLGDCGICRIRVVNVAYVKQIKERRGGISTSREWKSRLIMDGRAYFIVDNGS